MHYIILNTKANREVRRKSFTEAIACMKKFIKAGLLGYYKIFVVNELNAKLDSTSSRRLLRSYNVSNIATVMLTPPNRPTPTAEVHSNA